MKSQEDLRGIKNWTGMVEHAQLLIAELPSLNAMRAATIIQWELAYQPNMSYALVTGL